MTPRKDLQCVAAALSTRSMLPVAGGVEWSGTHFSSINPKVKLTSNFSEMLGLGIFQASSVSTERFVARRLNERQSYFPMLPIVSW